MKLTQKQEMFCVEYIATGNASESYRRAYRPERMTDKSVNEKGSQMLAMVKIRSRIDELNSAAVSAAVMTRQEALERLSGFARTDLSDLVEFGEHSMGEDEDGNVVIQASWKIKASAAMDKAKMAAISELTAGRDGIKIKTHSPLQAIQQLAKMQGWESASKIDHTNSDGSLAPAPAVVVTPEAVKDLASKLVD